MSPLPEKGDVARAVAIWNARLNSAVGSEPGDPPVQIGDVNVSGGELDGEGAPTLRMMYGDLLDVGETLTDAGADVIHYATELIESGRSDLRSELANVFLQGAGLGVLMERGRS